MAARLLLMPCSSPEQTDGMPLSKCPAGQPLRRSSSGSGSGMLGAVEPLSETDLILATARARASFRCRAEAVARGDFTDADWELLELGIDAGAREMLALLSELHWTRRPSGST